MKNRWMTYLLMIAVSIVSLQCTCDDEPGEGDPGSGNSTEKSITSFNFDGVTGVTTAIDQSTKTVTLIVPFGTDRETLVPIIGISPHATISPASNVMQDFTSPVIYTVTAQNASQQAYTVTVVVAGPTVSCLPTSMPNADYQLDLAYGLDGKVSRVTYNNLYAIDPGARFINFANYYYTGGLLSRIDYDLTSSDDPDPDIDDYHLFEYYPDKIVVNTWDDNFGVWEHQQILTYYLTDDKVTSFTTYWATGERWDSTAYTFNATGNLIRSDKYDGDRTTSVEYYLFEYDNKINVFALTGISGFEMLFFFNEYNLSVNNITKRTYHYHSAFQDIVHVTDFAYTYDAENKPLTLSWSFNGGASSPTYPYVYPCE